MPTSLASLLAPVHPHQIEVQDFGWYALIVDARSAAAFAVDHIPGAINVPRPSPVEPDDAGALPAELAECIAGLRPNDTVLIYCDRGGLDARAYAEPLRAAGWAVDVLAGGWGNYRRWVTAGLEVLPRILTMRRLVAPPVSGLCRVLAVLGEQGEQVLDVSELCGQKLVPGMTLKGDQAPSQDAFETSMLDALRSFDPERAVWVRYGPAPPKGILLPPAFREALDRAECVLLEVPRPERARAWLERIQAMHTTLTDLVQALRATDEPPSERHLVAWASLAREDAPIDALSAIIDDYIDPNNEVVVAADQHQRLEIRSLDLAQVKTAVRDWLRVHSSPGLARR
jgi:tRNA 2-selenouridine synthase